MKILLTILLILSFSVCAHAADFSTINEGSLAAFIELMPQYKEIIQGYAEDVEVGEDLNMVEGSKMQKDIVSLMSKYEISPEEFAAFLQKITMAFATAQMKATECQLCLSG